MGGLKWLFGLIGALVVIVVVVAVLVVTNIDRIIQRVVEDVGSDLTGTPVNLGGVSISLKTGTGEMRRLWIGNPPGFDSAYAFQLDTLMLDLDIESLTSEVIVVDELVIDGANLTFEQRGRGNNLQTILDHMDQYSEPSTGEVQDTDAKRYIVESFKFLNGSIALEAEGLVESQEVAISDIALKDVGKASGGETATEIARQLLEPVMSQAASIGDRAFDAALAKGKQELGDELDRQKNELEDETRDKLKDLLPD